MESSYLPGWPITPTDAVPLPSIWTLHRTVCLLKDHKANNVVPISVRHSPDNLFRRSVTGSAHQGSTVGESFNDTMAVHQLGVPDKYPKVHHNHNLSPRVFVICIGHRNHETLSPNAQHPFYPEEGISPSFTQEGTSEGLGMSHWDTGSNQASCIDRASTLLCTTRLEDTITPAFVRSDISEPFRGGTSRSSMVGFRPEFQLLSHDSEARSFNTDSVRCLHVRLGSSLPGVATGCRWTSEEAGLHINLLKLQAAFLAL